MALKLGAAKTDPPLATLVVANLVRGNICVSVEWDTNTYLKLANSTLTRPASINRYLVRNAPKSGLYGETVLEQTEVDSWMGFSDTALDGNDNFPADLNYLDTVLGPVTYLVASRLTLADLIIWESLYKSKLWNQLLKSGQAPTNVARWYKFISSLDVVMSLITSLPEAVKSPLGASGETMKPKDEGKFVELPGAEMGKVVVRFPPEASGYLHIGHAKAALLNQYYKDSFKGTLIMRFDDTNPAKEKVDFEKVILEDLEKLKITPDKFTHTSNYFEVMLEFCEKLLHQHHAYVDDTNPELMKQEREQRLESKNRNNSVPQNLKMWEEMKAGTEFGQRCCVRAKIDMKSDNGCMRDPTIYRCKAEAHPRTGTKYKVYPTYDFACPIVDSIEGVTHCLRTTEYRDRDEQFYWFIDILGLRKPHIWEYSRLNMMNTVLSKRKLTWFVEQGLVDGWDDPRFPTVQGILRRGMTVEGLKQFIIAQGSSRSVVLMEWDKIWAFNKKIIDPIAPRYTSLRAGETVPVLVKGVTEQALTVSKHPKDPAVGTKTIWVGPRVLIDREDAETLKEGEHATFINWGNLLVQRINRNKEKIVSVEALPNLENTDYKRTVKLTWLADTNKAPFVPCVCVYFDHIIRKAVLGKDEDFKQYVNRNTRSEVQMLGDPELLKVKKSDILQLQRRGFFICDAEYRAPSIHTSREAPIVLFYIPDGKSKELSTFGAPKEGKETANITATKTVSKEKSPAKVAVPPPAKATLPSTPGGIDVSEILRSIQQQGDKIRKLKSEKADKETVTKEVNVLLKLKEDFKAASGVEWKPGVSVLAAGVAPLPAAAAPPSNTSGGVDANEILKSIQQQGDKVRKLKSEKADKEAVTKEINVLLKLKEDLKTVTGIDWKPGVSAPSSAAVGFAGGATMAAAAQASSASQAVEDLHRQIVAQGDKVRAQKSAKAAKDVIDAEVKTLLKLKEAFKQASGIEWKPGMTVPTASAAGGDTGQQSPSANVKAQVAGNNVQGEKAVKNAQKAAKPRKEKVPLKKEGEKKQSRLGIEASKEDNLSEWYSQVITKGELIEYYDVSGCYIYRPWSFAIWEFIKDFLDCEIKKIGVQNCYFPLFVSRSVLEKEKTHIADFAPEVAWVTKSGETDLAEPIAVRPTSETVMYPAYAKWIQSYRDLPLKLNQWNNVVRWEFKQPQPFLRTREFLWQEGHTAHASKADAEEEVLHILELYEKVYTDLLAIPVIKGRKTEKEKFAGGDYTTTVEGFISASGRAIQGATSHHLGQNFSKMFEIVYEDPETAEKKFVYQNSWGLTTRTIGVMIMVHADNRGLVLPPNVASIQVVIVPCGITASLAEDDKKSLLAACKELEIEIKNCGIRVLGDYRDNYSPGWRFNHWELKGVPVRIEYGPKDIAQQQVVAVRRDTSEKITLSRSSASQTISSLLNTIQSNLYSRAKDDLVSHTVVSKNWDEFCKKLDEKNIILSPFCGVEACEEEIKKGSARDAEAEPGAPSMGAKSLCIPFTQPAAILPSDGCINPECKKSPKFYTLFGRSY